MAELDHALSNPPIHKKRRRELRKHPTPAEAALWKHLQRRQLQGKKFRRQFGIGPYIVDFYCPECGVIVELDGECHYSIQKAEYDEERTLYLHSLGMRVVRFENRAIFENIEAVLVEIGKLL